MHRSPCRSPQTPIKTETPRGTAGSAYRRDDQLRAVSLPFLFPPHFEGKEEGRRRRRDSKRKKVRPLSLPSLAFRFDLFLARFRSPSCFDLTFDSILIFCSSLVIFFLFSYLETYSFFNLEPNHGPDLLGSEFRYGHLALGAEGPI